MTSIFHYGLSRDLSLALNDADDFNVIIHVGESPNTKEFRVHSVILRARSPYFKSAFSSKWIIKKNDMIVYNKPNITPIVFDMILKYMYTGELDLSKQLGENIFDLLIASDELLLEELFKHVQGYLIEKHTSWIQQNFVLVLQSVFKLANCKELQDYCLETICTDPQPFISSKDFTSLDRDIFYILLERDDLQIEEIDAWDCLIKWGIEQTPGLGGKNSTRTNWNGKNYRALKKTLSSFVHLIRFVEISPEDFFDKVRPFRAAIPNHIYEEIEEFHYKKVLPKTITLPSRIGTPASAIIDPSAIIKPKLATIIANWIDRNDSAVLSFNNNYKFNLIYLKSRDGLDCNTFNNKCNGQGPFILLIRVKSKKIYGGFNPIGYTLREGQWLLTSDSFIFSFENNQDTRNMKIGRVINKYYSVYEDYFQFFFNFGNHLQAYKGNGQNFFYLGNHRIYSNIFNRTCTRDYPIEEIEEMEVFSVVRK